MQNLTEQKLYAHFYRAKRGGWEVSITATLNPIFDPICVQRVAGKRDARKVAEKYGATCWNF